MDAVAAATASAPRLYALGSVPDTPDMPYSVYSATLGRGDVLALTGSEGIRWGQVVVQSFARETENASDAAEAIRALLVGVQLDITGYSTTPCEQGLDPSIYRDPDDRGVIGVTQTFTFTATT